MHVTLTASCSTLVWSFVPLGRQRQCTSPARPFQLHQRLLCLQTGLGHPLIREDPSPDQSKVPDVSSTAWAPLSIQAPPAYAQNHNLEILRRTLH